MSILGLSARSASIFIIMFAQISAHNPVYSPGEEELTPEHNCTWDITQYPYRNQTYLTQRLRQCYSCNDTMEGTNKCWSDPPSPQFIHCGFMGDEVCTCVQEWYNIKKGSKGPVRVNRECMKFSDIKEVYGLDIEEVSRIGCKNVSRKLVTKHEDGSYTLTGKTEYVEACFCESDKCNHDQKHTSRAVPQLMKGRLWTWIQFPVIILTVLINTW